MALRARGPLGLATVVGRAARLASEVKTEANAEFWRRRALTDLRDVEVDDCHERRLARTALSDPVNPAQGEPDIAGERLPENRLVADLHNHRWTNLASGDTEHGFLFEASLILQKYLRLGLGYNFTRFSDDELVRNRIDNRGVFFRVVGMY